MSSSKRQIGLLVFIIIFYFQPQEAYAAIIGLYDKTLSVLENISGEVAAIGSQIPSLSYNKMSTDAIDSLSHQYYVQGAYSDGLNRMFVFDTLTGDLLSDTVMSNDFEMVQYDSYSNQLIGMNEKALSYIDPFTGKIASIGEQISLLSYYIMGTDAIDSLNHQYYVQGAYADGVDHMFVFDTLTGNLLSDPIMSYDFRMVQYDQSSTPVPEPSSLLLLIGGVSLLFIRKNITSCFTWIGVTLPLRPIDKYSR